MVTTDWCTYHQATARFRSKGGFPASIRVGIFKPVMTTVTLESSMTVFGLLRQQQPEHSTSSTGAVRFLFLEALANLPTATSRISLVAFCLS